jgi:cytochrome c553
MKWLFCAIFLTATAVGLTCYHGSALGNEVSFSSSTATESNGPIFKTQTSVSSEDDEELTIKKIMKRAHKSGLLKSVATGRATDAEIAQLHHYYQAMPKLSPPNGEEKSWKKKTEALIEASRAAIDKDPNAGQMLKSATDCAACHDVHK